MKKRRQVVQEEYETIQTSVPPEKLVRNLIRIDGLDDDPDCYNNAPAPKHVQERLGLNEEHL